MAADDEGNSWSELPADIAILIADQEQLSVGDIVRMAKVCKSWRSILLDRIWSKLHINSNIGRTPFPWLMLAEPFESKNNQRSFFNPVTGQSTEIYLPEAAGRRCCGSSHGWIVTIGEDMDLNLLNPLTRKQINLPSQLTFDVFSDGTTNKDLDELMSKQEKLRTFFQKVILTCDPEKPEDLETCTAVAFICPIEDFQLAFAKPGDTAWTLLPVHLPPIDDFIFYKGKLYGVNCMGELMSLDLHDEHKWKVISPALSPIWRSIFKSSFYNYYLATIADIFTVVVRFRQFIKGPNKYRTVNALVFEFRRGEWRQIKDIGNCCLFVGSNETICISPVPRGFRCNSIYFTDDYNHFSLSSFYQLTGHDMLVYSMEDGDFSSFYGGASLSPLSPPIWVTLTW